MKERLSRSLNSTAPLMTNPLFKWALILLMGGSLLLLIGLPLFQHFKNGWQLCGTPDCIRNFSDLMKIPLTVFTLSLGLLGLIAAIVRSSQTAKQIGLSEQQMVARNYYDHKKDFVERVGQEIEQKDIHVSSIEQLYRLCFPDNNELYFSPTQRNTPTPQFVQDIEEIVKVVRRHFRVTKAGLIGKGQSSWEQRYREVVWKVRDAAHLMRLGEEFNSCKAIGDSRQAARYMQVLFDAVVVCDILTEYCRFEQSKGRSRLLPIYNELEEMKVHAVKLWEYSQIKQGVIKDGKLVEKE